VPVGVPGEILVGGAGVARGYLRRPELTADRFIDAPAAAGGRWYRTGDRARWLPAGGLEYLGRLDDQVKVRGYRIEPGEIETVLNRHPQVRESAVVTRERGLDGHRQLVAYLVPEPGAGLSWPELRSWLSDRLPDHLVPASGISLDRLPLTPNGKLDRAALPAPGPDRTDQAGRPVAPRTDFERILLGVVAEVLGRERVGLEDNFFELGGDSILTIQVASRARRRGVSVTPAQLFAHQSVAGLAAVAVAAADGGSGAEQGEVTGEVPATPVQTWFHRLALPRPGEWNLPVLLVARQPPQTERLSQALTALAAHHDLLRLRVTVDRRGEPRQRIAPVAGPGPVPVREFDLTSVDRYQLGAQIDGLARGLSGGLDLASGRLLRAAVFRAPPGEPDRVLLVAHHLVVDAVSWQILLEDLDTAYRQLAEGAPVQLPAKTTDFARWARHLVELAGSDQVAQEAGWWLTRLPPRAPELPVDGDPDAPNLEGDAALVTATLDEPATRALLTLANQAYRTRTDELLAVALARLVAGWTGEPQLLVDVEGHGRDLPVEGVDVSRTVGWFSTITPTWLDLSGVDRQSPAQVIKVVKEQLRAMPGRGAAYGLARWLRDDQLARRLSELPKARISFHHLGRIDQQVSAQGRFALAPEPAGGARHPANPRPYLIEVVTWVRDGRLHLCLTHSTRHHARSTIERLASSYLDGLRSLVDHCRSPGAGGLTPSDFPLAQVDQRQLDRLVAEHGPVDDLYPLAPLQRGLLFHTLANPHSGVYFEQFSIGLDGPLDPDALVGAWVAVHQRHAVLRSAIAWQALAVPHLVIRERVDLPLTHHDWCDLPSPRQAARLEELLARDRIQGFDLSAAPLTRLHLIRLGEQRWNLVWSHHHILLDRWSVALVIQELFDTYHAIRAGRHEPALPPRPFRDYLGYLAGLNQSGAPAYWRRVLRGVTRPTPLDADRPAVRSERRDADYARLGRRLSRADSEAVRAFARTHRITLDTVLHGAWALVLAQRSGLDDVVFAVTSAGRPTALAGVEEMVGLFINTLPARVRVSRDQPVASWLAGLLRQQVRAREFEHTPLEQIRSWSSVPPDQPLFESGRALVNFPWDGSRYRTGEVAIREIRTFEQASHAVTFLVVPGEELDLQLWYDARRFAQPTAEHLLQTVQALISALVADPDRSVGELLARLPAGQAPVAPTDATLPELVAYWAARQPERTAVSDGGGRLSYSQLDRRADRLAGWLRELGAGPGARVGVALPRSVDQIAAMLGVLKAGAVCVPLPAGGPPAGPRLEPSARLSLCLVPGLEGSDDQGSGPDGRDGMAVVRLDPGHRAAGPGGPLERPVRPADPATVGWWPEAGGEVTAVELTHGELSRRAAAWREEIAVPDVVAQLADAGSEVAAWEIWVALANGAGLAVCPAAGRSSPAAGWESLRQQAVTVLTLTAGELTRLLDQQPQALGGVRLLLLRGELPTPYARRLRAAAPSLTLAPAADLELGRLRHRLRALPAVREAAVRPAPDGRRLTAYLVPDPRALDRGGALVDRLATRHLERWRARGCHPGTELAGTVGRLRELRPARVLEIGCGTGGRLFGLLDRIDQYVGTDLASEALAQVRARLSTQDAAARAKVTLLERAPDDLTGLAPDSFDLVVLDSVVPYLPGGWYLARLLDLAIRAATRAGRVFVGGVRHLGLQEACQLSVELARAVDLLPAGELYARVSRSIGQQRELLVDPGYFTGLAAGRPEVGGVEVRPRPGPPDHPLSRFQYDVVLWLGVPPAAPAGGVRWYDWRQDVLSPDEIEWLLDRAGGDAVGVTGVPNPRVAADLEAARLLTRAGAPDTAGELRLAAGRAPVGLDPDQLSQLGQRRGWSVRVGWATDAGRLDALFQRDAGQLAGPVDWPAAGGGPQPDGPLTNTPLRGALDEELARLARDALGETPADGDVLVVEELPRTAAGELDEAALPVGPEPAGAAGPVPAGAVPPRTVDEFRLARIWEQVLGASSLDVRASFFDLGGDSMLAIRLIDEATRTFGRAVPLAALLQQPTIEGMAAALRAEPGPWTPLVEITPGDRTPFFCVHPAGGNVLCYGELARLVSPQPFYALQARGVEGNDPPHRDLPEMAARYLADVRARQATGPYLLGGWSMGGLVAYEMARQLAAAGDRVGLLVLIDTPTPDLIGELPDEAAALARLLEGVVPVDLTRLRAMPARERLRHVLAEAERVHMIPPGMDPDRAQQLFEVYAAHVDAVRRYRPGRFAGPVRLLRAIDSEITAADYGWGGLLTGAWEVVDVPGNHESVVWPPNVQRVAEVLREQLEAALARG
jgi:non-ribosomal peptide synthase protein (TIGR01720 family)